MKKVIYILLPLLLILVSCTEDKTVDITVLPDETTAGLNTFGCLMDGWVYVGGRYGYWDGIMYTASISFHNNEANEMEVDVLVKPGKVLSFTILQPEEGQTSVLTDILWDGEKLTDGTAVITRFDTDARIISGRFENGFISEGRFDVQYRNQ